LSVCLLVNLVLGIGRWSLVGILVSGTWYLASGILYLVSVGALYFKALVCWSTRRQSREMKHEKEQIKNGNVYSFLGLWGGGLNTCE
jgi:hypothetical protein